MSGPTKSSLPPIRACLFDMDGLLLDSEDKYTACTNAVLSQFGKPNLPWSVKAQLQGRPGPEAGKIFHDWAQLPISHEDFLARQTEMQAKLFPTCKPLPGVENLLRRLKETENNGEKRVYLALATSSRKETFEFKTAHLSELFSAFKQENKVLGDDTRIPKGRGKPCPDIYLLALKTVNEGIRSRRKEGSSETEIKPEECLVFEDSVPGVEAGRRAGMQVLWVPHEGLLNEYKGKEKEVLAGRSGMVHAEMRGSGDQSDMQKAPGEIDDGWGRLIMSLEQFPYDVYGIKA
ncbi:putative haloacid dehalogenase-like hydrolase 6 [Elsinoe fawcettii]|nr:putative haloacid dehalogenase-like hydrolase 6 [Elsinoe fawcettii]